MDKIQRLILKNQMVMMEALKGSFSRAKFEIQCGKTKQALAPQSDEMGFEKDIEEDSQSCSTASGGKE